MEDSTEDEDSGGEAVEDSQPGWPSPPHSVGGGVFSGGGGEEVVSGGGAGV